jgi:hypothetical protein
VPLRLIEIGRSPQSVKAQSKKSRDKCRKNKRGKNKGRQLNLSATNYSQGGEKRTVGGINRKLSHRLFQSAHFLRCAFYFDHESGADKGAFFSYFNGLK